MSCTFWLDKKDLYICFKPNHPTWCWNCVRIHKSILLYSICPQLSIILQFYQQWHVNQNFKTVFICSQVTIHWYTIYYEYQKKVLHCELCNHTFDDVEIKKKKKSAEEEHKTLIKSTTVKTWSICQSITLCLSPVRILFLSLFFFGRGETVRKSLDDDWLQREGTVERP